MDYAGSEMLGPDNAIWDDGEWVSWSELDYHFQQQQLRERYPDADLSLIPIFEDLLATAEDYFHLTGRHLQVYGDIGELYGAITYGIRLHRNYAQGSDGKLGNDFVEVKTITPFKRNDVVELNMSRNFSKVLIVKISADFEVSGRLIGRRALPKSKKDRVLLDWAQFDDSHPS
ncbi:hypothetical protein [Sphingopyxis sp. A083]|uniref:hypothetical protein n=1 Tax=Sphingopyxis sp. A083 TaxID=1759083 RepID=UPI0007364DEF|nr:hypothetical protein [Sphingopyxis sp. A083]KTE75066.1 hypothetical protein ATE59_14525 [Sphingopyxis sp. A083]